MSILLQCFSLVLFWYMFILCVQFIFWHCTKEQRTSVMTVTRKQESSTRCLRRTFLLALAASNILQMVKSFFLDVLCAVWTSSTASIERMAKKGNCCVDRLVMCLMYSLDFPNNSIPKFSFPSCSLRTSWRTVLHPFLILFLKERFHIDADKQHC